MEWSDYLMKLAWTVSEKSKDARTKVGCVIVGPCKEIRSTGFNGLPMGVADDPARMTGETKRLWTSHAEANAIAFAARNGHRLDGSTIYVTHPCCAACSRLIIQAGIIRVVVGDGTFASSWEDETNAARTMFAEAGVEVEERG